MRSAHFAGLMKSTAALVLFFGISSIADAHQTLMSDQPWQVCRKLEVGDQCAWTNSHDDVYRGTCRSISDELVCVRNKPIEKKTVDQEIDGEQQVPQAEKTS